MYDAIIVGARCAGSPTAMLLARQGYRVLVVDRASFPSDTLSTHGIQQAGIARLRKWGLLDAVRARTPDTGVTTIHIGGQKILPPPDPGVPDGKAFSPRRYILDQILLDAAVAAGAEAREEFTVDDLLFEGYRVVGIRGHARGGKPVEERARIVVGADGKHSFVARRVGAQAYHERPTLTLAYFSYFSGVGLTDTDLYVHPDAAVFGWPTNDNLSLIGIMRPVADARWYRADIENNMMRDIKMVVPELAQCMHAGKREERISGSVDLPNFFRQPFGPGWVLAGDAGYTKDPITALGISDAFRAAEQVADAIDDGFSGRRPLQEALAGYQSTRDEKAMALYQFTLDLASFKNARAQHELIESRIPATTAA
jgi:flavin-dependent dehydrogenase